MTQLAPAVSVPDLTACDREPIHIPGSVQPHGFLVATDESTGIVRQVSVNVRTLLGFEPAAALDRPLETVFGPAAAKIVELAARDPLLSRRAVMVDRFTKTVNGTNRTFALVAHRFAGHLVVEGELIADVAQHRDTHYQLEGFLNQMESAPNVPALLQLAAMATRDITGFDRVMVYQFDPEWNGIVVAEDRNSVLPSYLDLRFPASDIPRQARELYRINRLRLIASSQYEPVPLVASRVAGGPLDLTLSVLRSVSPVHLEYMRNMGTGSSMSISLIRGGNLWGLISCHSAESRVVPFEVRSTCDLLGQVLSLQLAARESGEALQYGLELRSHLSILLAAMSRQERFTAGLAAESKSLLQLTAATGAAVVIGGEVTLHGRTPTKSQVAAIVDWLAQQSREDVFATDTLPLLFPPAKDYTWSAAGLIAISISRVHRSYVLWFRPEVIATVNWGGDPSKPVEKDNAGTMRIHPRRSFEMWVETVRGQAQSWRPPEVAAARELRFAIIEIVLQSAERLAQLTDELTRTNKELETFSYTVSHDLRAPFRHIRGYAELLKLDKAKLLDDEGRQFVDYILGGASYAGRLVDNILAFSQMGRSPLQLSSVDLGDLLEDVLSDLRLDIAKRQIEWKIGPLPTIEADPAMIRTVLQNLVENAVKYTRDRKSAVIEIGSTQTESEHEVWIRDNGVGFDPKFQGKLFGMFQRLHRWEEFEGTGIGLASVRRIVGRHGGRVWAEGAVNEGATFHFALPKVPVAGLTLYA